MNIRISQRANLILERLEKSGYEAFVVGGCVRDLLRGKTPEDWDITTSALPCQIKSCFSDLTVIETGIKHGTVGVVWDGQIFEITTYRIDGSYSDGRHPDQVVFSSSLKEDLSRRDFTVNSMAYHPQKGLQDFFGGYEDLKRRLIRCVGNPDKRFEEDALRIMRGIRFASVLGFSVEPETEKAIVKNKQLLEAVSPQRLWKELKLLLCGKNVMEVLCRYASVLGVMIPEIRPAVGMEQNSPYHHLTVWEHIAQSVASAPPCPILRLSMLFHDLGKPLCYSCDENGIGHFYGHAKQSARLAEDILTRFCASNQERQEIVWLVKSHDFLLSSDSVQLKRLLCREGEQRVWNLLKVKTADIKALTPDIQEKRIAQLEQIKQQLEEIISKQQCFSLKQLAVSGTDLIEAGIPQGRKIGQILNCLFLLVTEEKLPNDKDILLQEVLKWKGEMENDV